MTRLHPSRPPRGSALAWLLVVVVAVILLALLPQFVKKPYVLHMGVVLFLSIIQGQAWNVIGGYTGQYSVGHAAFFGVGAYTTTMLLVIYEMPPWWGIWLGAVNAILISMIIGSITFRLRGPYFVLASISVAEIIRLASTSSSVIGVRILASGFRLACLRMVTAISASCALVVPWSSMWRRATSA